MNKANLLTATTEYKSNPYNGSGLIRVRFNNKYHNVAYDHSASDSHLSAVETVVKKLNLNVTIVGYTETTKGRKFLLQF